MVTLNGKTYRLKYTLRGLFIYEQIAGVPFSPEKTLNVFLLIFCFLIVNNEDFSMSFEKFVDILDNEPKTVESILKWMSEETDRMSLLSGEEPEGGEKKKTDDS